jgi:hypothetical protein
VDVPGGIEVLTLLGIGRNADKPEPLVTGLQLVQKGIERAVKQGVP